MVAILIFSVNSKMTVSFKILLKSEMYIFPRHIYVNIVPNSDNVPAYGFGLLK